MQDDSAGTRTGSSTESGAGGGGKAGSATDSQHGMDGLESVGLVADETRLAADADAAIGDVPPDVSGAIEQQLGGQLSQLTSWAQITGDGFDILSVTLLPQWHLTDAERCRLSEKVARLLDLTVPVHFSPVAEAVIGVTLCGGAICAARMMQNGGKLPPFGPPRAPAEPQPQPAAAARESAPLQPEQLTSLNV